MEEQLHASKKQVYRFAKLDIDNEQVMKQVLQRFIKKIEINEDETILLILYF